MKLLEQDNPIMTLFAFIIVVLMLVTMAGIGLSMMLGAWWCVRELWGLVV